MIIEKIKIKLLDKQFTYNFYDYNGHFFRDSLILKTKKEFIASMAMRKTIFKTHKDNLADFNKAMKKIGAEIMSKKKATKKKTIKKTAAKNVFNKTTGRVNACSKKGKCDECIPLTAFNKNIQELIAAKHNALQSLNAGIDQLCDNADDLRIEIKALSLLAQDSSK